GVELLKRVLLPGPLRLEHERISALKEEGSLAIVGKARGDLTSRPLEVLPIGAKVERVLSLAQKDAILASRELLATGVEVEERPISSLLVGRVAEVDREVVAGLPGLPHRPAELLQTIGARGAEARGRQRVGGYALAV